MVISIPVLICNLLEFTYISLKYHVEKFHSNVIIIFDVSKHLQHHGLANPLGLTILPPKYDVIMFGDEVDDYYDENDFVILCNDDYKDALYSIEKQSIIIPFGQSLLTYGDIYENNGLYGIITKRGDIIVEPKYEMIEKSSNCFIVRYNEKYGTLDDFGFISEYPVYDSYIDKGKFIFVNKHHKWGFLSINGKELEYPDYDDYDLKTDKELNEYAILKKDLSYYLFHEDCHDYFMNTKYEVFEIVTSNRLIVKNSHGQYGVIDSDDKTIIDFKYNDIYTNEMHFICQEDNIEYTRIKEYDMDGNLINIDVY